MNIGLGSSVVEELTKVAWALGSIPGPSICFQCVICPFLLSYYIWCCDQPLEITGEHLPGERAWVIFQGEEFLGREECSIWGYIARGYRLVSSVKSLTRVAGVPGSIPGPSICFQCFIC